jgi:hypothetical protein
VVEPDQWQCLPGEVCDIADAACDMHGQQALGEAVILVRLAAVMQLSDAGDVVATFAQGVGPTLDASIISDGVVPGAVPVNRKACRKAGAGRNADRRWRVSGGEADTARSKRIQRRCTNNGVPGMAGNLAVVLSDIDDQQFCGLATIRALS